MPLFTIPESVFDLHRRAAILDTNVVYAAFNNEDARHDDCVAYLDIEDQYLVPLSVVVETWGLLVGRDRNWEGGFEFLRWINDPSSGVIVLNHCESMARIQALARSVHIDCVDATILYLADQISRECGYAPGIRVATYDTADFLRSMKASKFNLTIFDLRTLDDIDLS
jgi:predicted nucleic acid-binding protein